MFANLDNFANWLITFFLKSAQYWKMPSCPPCVWRPVDRSVREPPLSVTAMDEAGFRMNCEEDPARFQQIQAMVLGCCGASGTTKRPEKVKGRQAPGRHPLSGALTILNDFTTRLLPEGKAGTQTRTSFSLWNHRATRALAHLHLLPGKWKCQIKSQ